MSSPRHTIPPELQEALHDKSAEEQERIRQVWNLLGYLENEDLNVPDTDVALADLEQAIASETVPTPGRLARDRAPRKKSHMLQRLSIGATCTLVLFAVMIWFWQAPIVITAPLGEQVAVLLPDGSTVTLNSGSRIEYARRFESWPMIANAKRRVSLQGEAFFEVQKMDKPFVVESFNAQVRVLGTTFNVWAREHDNMPETRVTLASGKVLVMPNEQDDQPATLTEPGHSVRIISQKDGSEYSVSDTVPVERATAWRSNGFSAMKLSVGSVVKEAERRYKLTIDIAQSLDNTRELTFYFKEKPPAEELLESICMSLGCQYRQTSNGFSIFPMELN